MAGSLVVLALVLPAADALAARLVPDPSKATSMQIRGSVLDVTQHGVRMRIEPLDAAQVADWFRTHTRAGQRGLNLDTALVPADPVAPEAAAAPARGKRRPPQPLAMFAVSIENGTGESVTFLPQMCSVVDEHDGERSPLPSDFLRELFRNIFSTTPNPDRAADEAMAAVYGDPVILKSGQRVSRLLAFPPLQPKTKVAALFLRHVAIGQTEINPVFPYIITE